MQSGAKSFVAANFTPEQKDMIRDLLSKASSVQEVEEIESAVRRGVLPAALQHLPSTWWAHRLKEVLSFSTTDIQILYTYIVCSVRVLTLASARGVCSICVAVVALLSRSLKNPFMLVCSLICLLTILFWPHRTVAYIYLRRVTVIEILSKIINYTPSLYR